MAFVTLFFFLYAVDLDIIWSSTSLSSSSASHLDMSIDDKDKTIVGSSLRMAHDNNNDPSYPLPAPTEQALYSYLAGTPYGKLSLTSSSDSDSYNPYRHPWPEAQYAKQLALVKSNHPVVAVMAAGSSGSSSSSSSNLSPLARQLSLTIRSHVSPDDALGFEYFCLLPGPNALADDEPADDVASDPLLIVRIRRNSPFTRDWHSATAAAQACHSVLVSFGLNDTHCLVVEGADVPYCGSASDDTTSTALIRPGAPAAGPRDAAFHVNFPVDVDMYDQPCLSRRLLLGLTGQPGHSIATVANPCRAGTLGLVVLLDVAMGNIEGSIDSNMNTNTPPTSGGGSASSSSSSNSPVDPPAVIAKLLLTCRHVVDAGGPPSPSTGINRLREVLGGRSSGSAREQTLPIDFIQLGEKQFDRTLQSAQTMLKANARKLETLGAKDNLSRSQGSHRDRLERDSSTLAGFIAHLEKLKDPQSRYIGNAVLSPPLTGHDGGNDWALILSGIYSIDPTTQCGDNRDDFVFGPGRPGAGSIPKLNLFWIYELDQITREDLEQSFPSQMCNVAGTTSWPDSNLHFISLDTYFTQDTVRMRCRTALKTTQQDVLRYDKEDLAQHLGSKDAMTVYHVGATTGAQRGKLSHVKAHRFTGPDTEDVTVEYCILGHQGKDHFSWEGDSGSAIFGILPPSPGAGTDGNKDEGKRIGVVGLLRGGEYLRATTFVSDVTYATPIDRVMNHVGQQGRILNWRAI